MNSIVETFFYKKDGKSTYSEIKKTKDKEKRKKLLKDFIIEQGDIISNFPDNFLEIEFTKPLAFVIGNYTCDIPKSTTTMLHLLPIYPFKRLNLKLFKTFIETSVNKQRRKEIEYKDFNIENLESCAKVFNNLEPPEKLKYIGDIKSIFQFNNRNHFLVCPHEFNQDIWCFIDIQMIYAFEKQAIYPEIIRYINLSITSPWKEKFGSIIGSRFDKVAVDDFSNTQIREVLLNQLFR
ncbi:hypothetical protein LCGC14_0718610 [marine sediment metagenome]|uniref:Uncharacterized protein n=1 Tax=marine sediment metagenome TaxID=412755 RepID=A0A0F9SYH4_9ZZZZ